MLGNAAARTSKLRLGAGASKTPINRSKLRRMLPLFLSRTEEGGERRRAAIRAHPSAFDPEIIFANHYRGKVGLSRSDPSPDIAACAAANPMQNELIIMKTLRYTLGALALMAVAVGWAISQTNTVSKPPAKPVAETGSVTMSNKITKTEEEWKKELTSEQYYILRQKGTERAFTGKYWNTKDKGTYKCAGCGETLFQSETKYDSGCGWPSFYAPNATNIITETEDRSHFMVRTEVTCSKCGGHLGHVFDDGPKPTGLRYCINSASIKFEPKQEEKK